MYKFIKKGVDYVKFEKKIEDKLYRLNIWDISGNEIEDRVLPKYLFKSVDLFVLVISLDDVRSLNSLKYWIKHTDNKTFVLVKNKSDLRKISEDTIKKYKEEVLKNDILNLEKEFVTCSKDFFSLKKLFYFILEKFSNKILLIENEITKTEKSTNWCRKCCF